MPVFKFEAAPAFSDNYKIRNLLPKAGAHLNEERVGVSLNSVCCPIPTVLISYDNFTIKDIHWCVGRLTVDILSQKLL